MIRLIPLALFGLALFTGDASAFGRADRQERREQRQEARASGGCGQQPRGLAFRPQEAVAAVAAQVSAGLRPVASSCPGGTCPVPAVRR